MENIIQQLEQLSDDIDIKVTLTCSKKALYETNVVIGTWNDKSFAFDVFTNWRSGSLYTTGMTKDDLIRLFSDKPLAEMSSDDFQDLELVESMDGSMDYSDIDWKPELTEDEKDEVPEKSDLYFDGDITDCTYEIEEGGIESILIEAGDLVMNLNQGD